MPTVSVYLSDEMYRYLLSKGESASAVAKRLLEEKIREEMERRKRDLQGAFDEMAGKAKG